MGQRGQPQQPVVPLPKEMSSSTTSLDPRLGTSLAEKNQFFTGAVIPITLPGSCTRSLSKAKSLHLTSPCWGRLTPIFPLVIQSELFTGVFKTTSAELLEHLPEYSAKKTHVKAASWHLGLENTKCPAIGVYCSKLL